MIYIASSLLNSERIIKLMTRFRDAGIDITYDWTRHAAVSNATDEELAWIGQQEMNGVIEAEALLLVHPARNGSHVELGMALIAGIPVVILQEPDVQVEKKTFYYLKNVLKTTSEDEAFNAVMRIVKG